MAVTAPDMTVWRLTIHHNCGTVPTVLACIWLLKQAGHAVNDMFRDLQSFAAQGIPLEGSLQRALEVKLNKSRSVFACQLKTAVPHAPATRQFCWSNACLASALA